MLVVKVPTVAMEGAAAMAAMSRPKATAPRATVATAAAGGAGGTGARVGKVRPEAWAGSADWAQAVGSR